jgi:hypothetical protein
MTNFANYPSRCDHLGTTLPRLPFFLLDGYRVSPIALHGPLRAFAQIGVVPFAALPTGLLTASMAAMTAISTPKAQTDDVPGLIEMAAGAFLSW